MLCVVAFPLTVDADPPVRLDAHGDPLPPGAVARLGTTRYRHHGRHFAGFSADGKSLLFLGPQSYHWAELATGKITRAFLAPTLRDPQFVMHDGTLAAKAPVLAVSRWKNQIVVFDAYTGNELALYGQKDLPQPKGSYEVGSLSFLLAPDGKRLIVTGGMLEDTRGIIVFDTISKKRLHEFRGREDFVFSCMVIAGDGKTLAVVEQSYSDARKSTLITWDLTTGKQMSSVELSANGVWRFEPMPDGKTMLIASYREDGVRLISTTTGKEVRSFVDPDMKDTFRFASGADGKKVYTPGRGKLQEWDIETGKPGRTFKSSLLQPDDAVGAALAPDGKHLLGFGIRTWAVWDLTTGKELHATTGHVGPAGSVAFAPNSKRLVTCGGDKTTRLWDIAAGKQTNELRPKTAPSSAGWDQLASELLFRRCEFSADGKLVASSGANQALHVWDAVSGKLLQKIDEGTYAQPFAFAPRGQSLAMSDNLRVLRLLDAKTGKALRCWPWRIVPEKEMLTNAFQFALAFAPDGRLLALPGERVGTDNHVIDLWETATSKKRASLEFDVDYVTGLASVQIGAPFRQYFSSFTVDFRSLEWIIALVFSPDGKQLAAATLRSIHLFDVVTGKQVRTFGGPQVLGRGVAFSPDGKLIAAGQLDGSIRLWSLATGTVLRDVPGHDLPVSGLAFSPDGKLLASASADTTVLLWNVDELLQPQTKPGLTAKDLERLWADLADSDAEKAFRAIVALTAAPAETIAFFKVHLKPVAPVEPKRLEELLSDLDSPKYAVRDKATAQLEKLAELARSALEKKLAAKPTLEMRIRIEAILAKLDGPETRPEVLRGLRAVEVLERIGTPDARQVLKTIAAGAPDAPVTQDARAALARLHAK
jgi:WD40 repeat protein